MRKLPAVVVLVFLLLTTLDSHGCLGAKPFSFQQFSHAEGQSTATAMGISFFKGLLVFS
jgi:hypothetical protein